jgi:hypothetical protein
MEVRRPARFEDVFELTGDAEGTTRLAAGATALQLEWAMGKAPPDILVDISALPGMGAVSVADDRLRIGACVTLNSLIADDRIGGRLPMLHTALGNVAAPAVRNLATIGGNVAGRTGCLLPALVSMPRWRPLRPLAALASRLRTGWRPPWGNSLPRSWCRSMHLRSGPSARSVVGQPSVPA